MEEVKLTYDYKTIKIKRELETILTDSYEALGWEVTNTKMAEASLSSVNVSFKRNRKINNKSELLKLQEKIDSILETISKLMSNKKSAGIPESITVGTIGALTFGGGMSMTMLLKGAAYMAGGIAIGVAGIGIMLLGWLVHNKVHKNKLSKIEPILEDEYNKLADLCEEAIKLSK